MTQPAVAKITDQEYSRLRARLVCFFRLAGLPDPMDLADEVVGRVFVNVQHGEVIRWLTAYASKVAANLAMEERRRLARARHLVQAITDSRPVQTYEMTLDEEATIDCLSRCLRELSAAERKLLDEYYGFEGRERIQRHEALATKLGISGNALSTRIYRLRGRLLDCMQKCEETGGRKNRR